MNMCRGIVLPIFFKRIPVKNTGFHGSCITGRESLFPLLRWLQSCSWGKLHEHTLKKQLRIWKIPWKSMNYAWQIHENPFQQLCGCVFSWISYLTRVRTSLVYLFFFCWMFLLLLTFICWYIQANQVVQTSVLTLKISSRWFQFVSMFAATCGDAPIWLLSFNGVESKS